MIFITHNPHHAYPVGDRFVILNRGQSLGTFGKGEIDRQELVRLMAGGRELAELEHELAEIRRNPANNLPLETERGGSDGDVEDRTDRRD